ncbi:MAG: thioredoxin domain-containing protein [Bacteroidales bacterium]|nr:thioredoxin domain-containing protein [Bacteroidales bacterium]
MKLIHSKFLVFLILIIMLSSFMQKTDIKQVNAIGFKNILRSKPGILLDVRTLREFKNGHISEAGQLNYYALDFRQKLLMLPKNEPIYLYCNTGYRSERAAKILIDNGYAEVYNMEKGILEWNLYNLPVKIAPDANPDTDNKLEMTEYLHLIQQDAMVFIDFYAPWCAPCRKMMPMIDSLEVEYHEKIKIVKVNVDASKSLAKELKITGVPYLVLMKKGKILFSQNGLIERKDLIKVFETALKTEKTTKK